MTEDEQEAQSLRYARWVKVLPLSSGRIALLGPRCELYKIVDTWAEVLDNVSELRTAFEYKPKKILSTVPSQLKIDVDL